MEKEPVPKNISKWLRGTHQRNPFGGTLISKLIRRTRFGGTPIEGTLFRETHIEETQLPLGELFLEELNFYWRMNHIPSKFIRGRREPIKGDAITLVKPSQSLSWREVPSHQKDP